MNVTTRRTSRAAIIAAATTGPVILPVPMVVARFIDPTRPVIAVVR